MKIDVELALIDLAAAYEVDAEGALCAVQALLLDEKACRARIEFLHALKDTAESSAEQRTRLPSPDLPKTLASVREHGVFQAVAEQHVTVDQLAELTWDADALRELHRFYSGEEETEPTERSLWPTLVPRLQRWLGGRKFLFAIAATLLLCLFCGAVAYSDLWNKFAELRARLGLEDFVRFALEDAEHPSTDADRAIPLAVMGSQVHVRGTVNPSLIQAIDVEAARLTGASPGSPQRMMYRIPDPGPDGSLPVPFDVPLELPLDDQVWRVRVRLIPHERPANVARDLLEKTYTRYVKSQSFGPAILPIVPGGRPIPAFLRELDVAAYWEANGFFGDTGDIQVEIREGQVAHFVYEPLGRGFHTSETKDSREALGMGGCCWLAPANNWGTDVNGGVDLRAFRPRRMTWEARSLGPRPPIVFFWGISSPEWTGEGGRPRGGPLDPRDSLGLYAVKLDPTGAQELTADWQTFISEPFDFQPDDERLKRVVCGFAWKIEYHVPRDPAGKEPAAAPPRFEFEIRQVRLLK